MPEQAHGHFPNDEFTLIERGMSGVAKLQEPKFVYMNGKLRPWREAVLHIGCEAVTRGLNVFEGIKGYWQVDGAFGVVQLRRHYDRLLRSARLLHIPCKWSYDEFRSCHF